MEEPRVSSKFCTLPFVPLPILKKVQQLLNLYIAKLHALQPTLSMTFVYLEIIYLCLELWRVHKYYDLQNMQK